jgi:uncharacterized protein (UPF0276 family)
LNGRVLHDLVPIPFNEQYAQNAAKRIRDLQNIFEIPLAVENVSAYMRMPGSDITEAEFVSLVVEKADCYLMLDVNNIFVNATNFNFSAEKYIDSIPLDRVLQIHVAGHFKEKHNLLIDTHGAEISKQVFDLLTYCLKKMGRVVPILLERDHNVPDLAELEREVLQLKKLVGEIGE